MESVRESFFSNQLTIGRSIIDRKAAISKGIIISAASTKARIANAMIMNNLKI
jgi:hypothetical protein